MGTDQAGADKQYVIIGGGLTGGSAAQALREAGFQGAVTILAEEPESPYERPPLSKGYLAGNDARDVVQLHPAEWYSKNRVTVREGTPASAISLADRTVTLANGESLHWDKLLLATGASSRHFPAKVGGELPGVMYLRTVAESQTLREALEPGDKRVVIVGAGWIGLEVASAARGYNNDVTVLGMETIPLNQFLGDEVGSAFAALHTENGVKLRMNTGVKQILGDENGATGVELNDGEVVEADLVVVGIGAIPAVSLAQDAGLEVANGVVVDSGFASSDPDVYAAGDVASVLYPALGEHLRVEHWAVAKDTGAAAGRAMAGETVEYGEIPYFYTDQFDLGMEYSGYGPLTKDASVVIRGDLAKREFLAFWLKDGAMVAGMNVNIWDVNDTIQKLIRSGAVLDAAALADPSVELEGLVPADAAVGENG